MRQDSHHLLMCWHTNKKFIYHSIQYNDQPQYVVVGGKFLPGFLIKNGVTPQYVVVGGKFYRK